MKSGVMGSSPTVPRMPSVPKYFLDILFIRKRTRGGAASPIPAELRQPQAAAVASPVLTVGAPPLPPERGG